jgi:ankyrin repeat protein
MIPIDPKLAFALGEAVWDRDVPRVEQLLQQGGDPNAMTPNAQERLIEYAVRSGSTEVLKLLLAHGADPNTRSRQGQPVLHDALRLGVELLACLLDAGADPNATDGKLTTAMWAWGTLNGKQRTETLQLLIERGMDPNSSVQDEPLLFTALRHEDEAVVALLLARGADPNVRVRRGLASFEGLYPIKTPRRKRLLRMLLDGGLDVTNATYLGNPLVSRLVFDEQPALLKLVLEKGADPGVKSAGSTPLEDARFIKNEKMRERIQKILQSHLDRR